MSSKKDARLKRVIKMLVIKAGNHKILGEYDSNQDSDIEDNSDSDMNVDDSHK